MKDDGNHEDQLASGDKSQERKALEQRFLSSSREHVWVGEQEELERRRRGEPEPLGVLEKLIALCLRGLWHLGLYKMGPDQKSGS